MKKTDGVGNMFSIRFLGNAFINKNRILFWHLGPICHLHIRCNFDPEKNKKVGRYQLTWFGIIFIIKKTLTVLLQIHLNISVLSEIRQTWQAADIKIMLIILVVLVTRLRFEHIGMYLEEFKILKATGRVALLIAPCGQQLIGIVFLTIMSVVVF